MFWPARKSWGRTVDEGGATSVTVSKPGRCRSGIRNLSPPLQHPASLHRQQVQRSFKFLNRLFQLGMLFQALTECLQQGVSFPHLLCGRAFRRGMWLRCRRLHRCAPGVLCSAFAEPAQRRLNIDRRGRAGQYLDHADAAGVAGIIHSLDAYRAGCTRLGTQGNRAAEGSGPVPSWYSRAERAAAVREATAAW